MYSEVVTAALWHAQRRAHGASPANVAHLLAPGVPVAAAWSTSASGALPPRPSSPPSLRFLMESACRGCVAPGVLKEDNSKVGTGSSSESPLDSETSARAGASEKEQQRKRRARGEKNELLASLDTLLPDDARRGGFKGAGSRSAGVMGRSTFNILTDTIHHLRAHHAVLRLPYRDGLNPPLHAPPLAPAVCFCVSCHLSLGSETADTSKFAIGLRSPLVIQDSVGDGSGSARR